MDLSKFKTSDWLKAGGGAVFFFTFFLPWWKVDVPEVVAEFFRPYSLHGSDFTLTGWLPFLLLVAIAVLTVLRVLEVFKLPATIPEPIVFLGAAGLSVLLVVWRFLFDGVSGGTLTRGFGLFLALLAAIVSLVGTVLAFQESGGDLKDLTDVNKIKSQFGGTKSSPPPFPPPDAPSV